MQNSRHPSPRLTVSIWHLFIAFQGGRPWNQIKIIKRKWKFQIRLHQISIQFFREAPFPRAIFGWIAQLLVKSNLQIPRPDQHHCFVGQLCYQLASGQLTSGKRMNMDHLDVSFNVFGSNFTVNGAGVLGLDPMYIYIQFPRPSATFSGCRRISSWRSCRGPREAACDIL